MKEATPSFPLLLSVKSRRTRSENKSGRERVVGKGMKHAARRRGELERGKWGGKSRAPLGDDTKILTRGRGLIRDTCRQCCNQRGWLTLHETRPAARCFIYERFESLSAGSGRASASRFKREDRPVWRSDKGHRWFLLFFNERDTRSGRRRRWGFSFHNLIGRCLFGVEIAKSNWIAALSRALVNSDTIDRICRARI